MLQRELKRGRSRRSICTVTLDAGTVTVEFPHRGGADVAVFRYSSAGDAQRRFEDEVKKKQAAGYAETDRSLSRRTFLLIKGESKEFWVIELEGSNHHIRFGRMDNHAPGRRRHIGFSDEIVALASYYKKIDAKLREGYVEIDKRVTPYSHPAK
jgi:predicted DNA-binding WGR domain protein